MRVAIIHYWLVTWRGGEHVLKALTDLYPEADIYAHVVDPKLIERHLPGRKVHTTFVGRLPFARRWYQRYLPLMPLALEQLDLRRYDLVISSESGPAKGVLVPPHATHICYCHSPMRYVWDRYHDYQRDAGRITRTLSAPLLHYIRQWDQLSAQRVDRYVANSNFVATRIKKYYGRSSEVIYPPVAVQEFDATRPSEDFYLWVGQLVGYKRPDLAIEAFNRLGKPLVMIGEGPLLAKLRRIAKSNVRLLGRQPFEVIRDHYARCRALIFPGIEDFGIVPVEAMASGKPVIAFDYGGARETVIDGHTGVLFKEQTVENLIEAVIRLKNTPTLPTPDIRAHAELFSAEAFNRRFRTFAAQTLRLRHKHARENNL
jgi:glycosyltransferase involved in cell wall biosynthesis